MSVTDTTGRRTAVTTRPYVSFSPGGGAVTLTDTLGGRWSTLRRGLGATVYAKPSTSTANILYTSAAPFLYSNGTPVRYAV